MAFMVPLVKNHYDIYARNNPADHGTPGAGAGRGADSRNSLYLSATSLKSGAPVKKQYRIILTGGTVTSGKKKTGSSASVTGSKASVLSQGANGKLFYRLPSASISLPVRPGAATGGATKAAGKKSTGALNGQLVMVKAGSNSADSSPTSHSPPSRPFPHVQRTVRNPVTNRVYSYSVSIPDYVAEEEEEEALARAKEAEEEDLNLEIDIDEQVEEDKENRALLLFSTSAPSGTGPIDTGTPTPTPPPPTSGGGKKLSLQLTNKKKPPLTPSLSLPVSPDIIISPPTSGKPRIPALIHSASTDSASEAPPPTSNSREYVELLRKFIFHLKMLKIGGGGGKKGRSGSKSEPKVTPTAPPKVAPDEANNNEPKRVGRKRKDTMEDSKVL